MRWRFRSAAVVLATSVLTLCTRTPSARAQSMDSLRAAVGHRVRVQDSSGARMAGLLVTVGDSGLVLDLDHAARPVPMSGVRRVERGLGRDRAGWAALAFLPGIAVGSLIGYEVGHASSRNQS